MRREAVDQPAGLQRLYAMDHARWSNETVAGGKNLRALADGDFELALCDRAPLHMRV